MASVVSQIEQAVGGFDLASAAGPLVAQVGQIQQAVAALSNGGGFQQALSGLSAVQAPQLSFGASLGGGLSGVLPSLQGELGGLVGQLQGDVGALPARLRDELQGAIDPLLKRVEALRTLLAEDWSCGLVPSLAAPAAAAPPPPGPPPPGPPVPPAPAAASNGAMTTQQVDAAKAVLDKLPADLSVPSLLAWVHERVGTVRPGYFTVRSLPLFDDIRDPLDTLLRWDGLNAAAVEAELQQTLAALTAIVHAQSDGVFATALPSADVAALPTAAVNNAAGAYADALETLASAVQAADAAALPAAFAAAQSARGALTAANASLASADATRVALIARLRALPSTLDAGVCRLLVLLQPRPTLGDLADAIGPFDAPTLPPAALAPLTDALAGLQAQLTGLLDGLDIASVAQPVTDALAGAEGAIQAVEQGLAQLSAQALQAIGQAQTALGAFDLAALRQEGEQALQSALGVLTGALSQSLGNATGGLTGALDAVNGTLDAIDPEALTQPIRDALTALGDLLQQGAISRIVEVAQQLDQLAQTVARLGFEPVADEVIALIDELQALLAGIDIASLPDPGPALIGEAMKVLPPSLQPLVEPLIVDLDGLIEGSPVALLEQGKALPDLVRAKLFAFSPRLALGPLVSAPFQQAAGALDDFSPAQWFEAGDDALAKVRDRLARQLDPTPLLAAPAQAHAALLAELDQLRPSTLLAPLEAALEQALQGVATALPVGDLAAALNGVLDRVRGFTGTVTSAIEVAQHLTGKLAALADPQAEFDSWLSGVVAKVPASATGPLAAAVADLRSAALGAHPVALDAAWQNARTSLAGASANAAAQLTRLTLARSRIQAGATKPAVAGAVPALAAWVAQDATRKAADGVTALAAVARALGDADQALATQLAQLGSAFPGTQGPLGAFVPAGPATLRSWVDEAVRRQLGVPLLALLGALKPLVVLLNSAVSTLGALVAALDAKVTDLLAAPQALADLLASVAGLQQRIGAIDLGLYTREIDALYQSLVDQVRALDPRTLAAPLVKARDTLLAQLSMKALLPPALRAQLDALHRALQTKLRAADPDALLLEPLEAEYRALVEPLAAALDISAALQILIDWLRGLPDDLRVQLLRVDDAYGKLLRSAPGGGAVGASASLSI